MDLLNSEQLENEGDVFEVESILDMCKSEVVYTRYHWKFHRPTDRADGRWVVAVGRGRNAERPECRTKVRP